MSLEKGVGQHATQEDRVGTAQQAFQQARLVGQVGTAQDGDERPRDFTDQLTQELHLALHLQPHAFGRHEPGHSDGRGVRQVRDCEGIVDVDVGVAGKGSGESLVVGLFAGREAQVLQHGHAAVAQVGHHLLGAVAHWLIGQNHIAVEKLDQAGGHWHEGKRWVRSSLGPTEM